MEPLNFLTTKKIEAVAGLQYLLPKDREKKVDMKAFERLPLAVQEFLKEEAQKEIDEEDASVAAEKDKMLKQKGKFREEATDGQNRAMNARERLRAKLLRRNGLHS